ncbi:hypothetical protein VNI00_013250 [Paramarasmius palmivorus]|uniref:Uncharacterized protein n=1 Tax=Paramarasmius palmivorus TaxID=297713 RepID=A0AAW0C187_9AGAR
MPLFKRKDKDDGFLPIQAPPANLSPSPTPSSRSSKRSTPHQTLQKPPPRKATPPPNPPHWPSHMHNKCSRSKCDYPNPPQCASGTYTCIGCRKGTYFITPAMAESAVSLSQKTYRFDAENKRQLKLRQEEAERVNRERDYKRYREEEERRQAILAQQELMRRRAEADPRRQEREDERRRRAYEAQHAVYEPVGGYAPGHREDRVPKRKVSLSDFPMPPQYYQSTMASSRQRCVSGGEGLRTKPSTPSLAPSSRSARFARPAPRQQIPQEYYPYPEVY